MAAQPRPADLVLIVTPDERCGTAWLKAIEDRGPPCILSFSSKKPRLWYTQVPIRVAVVDNRTDRSRDFTQKLLRGGTRVIAVSASPNERLLALEEGCDAAVSLDSRPEEIAHVVTTTLKNGASNPRVGRLQVGPLEIDFGGRKVRWHDEPIHLSPTLFNLLAVFAEHPREILETDTLLAKAWGNPYLTRENVWTGVHDLREVLQDHGHIRHRRGYGYTFEPAEPAVTKTPLGLVPSEAQAN